MVSIVSLYYWVRRWIRENDSISQSFLAVDAAFLLEVNGI